MRSRSATSASRPRPTASRVASCSRAHTPRFINGKRAQAELLRVVKVDRSSRQGFALLGEVLLRRSDFERAVPVLAARAEPRSDEPADPLDVEARALGSGTRSAAADPDADATARRDQLQPVDQGRSRRHDRHRRRGRHRRGRSSALHAPVPAASPAMPTMAMSPAEPESALWGAIRRRRRARTSKTSPPPPANVPDGVRPRVILAAKEKNAAAASLRQSAAVGENYLNDLLDRRPARRRRRPRAGFRFRSASGSALGSLDASRVHLLVRRA